VKLSTRGRYALRLMLDIALQPEDTSVSIKSIAQRQGISVKYLEQIVTPLVRGGYLRASRGAQGGYQLNRPTKEYTVGMILRTIEGSLAPVSCLDDTAEACERECHCVTVEVYRRIDDAIDQVVDNITLQDLVDIQHQKWGGNQPPQETKPE
jgi:Rrf2 family protein